MIILLPIALTVAFFGCGGDDLKSINTPSNGKSNFLRTPDESEDDSSATSDSGSSSRVETNLSTDHTSQPHRSPVKKPSRHKPQKPDPQPSASIHTTPVITPHQGEPVPSRPEPPRSPEAPMAPQPVIMPPPPPRTHPLVNIPAVQEAADGIGAAYRNRLDWERYTFTVAELLTRPALDRIQEANMDDFWTRAQGASVLMEAIGDVAGCPDVGYDNACHALMMLVGNMILTNDQREVGYFFQETGITAFIRDHAAELAAKLSSSEVNSLNPSNFLYSSGISRIAEGMVRGYAAKWVERFPEILTTEPIRPELPRIVVMHGIARIKAMDGPIERFGGYPDFTITRSTALESFAAQFPRHTAAYYRAREFSVRYTGETAGGPGLTQELFGVLQTAINGKVIKRREESDVDQLDVDDGVSREQLKAVGSYFGLCILRNRPTSWNLSRAFFKLLAGSPLSAIDIYEIDRGLYNTLSPYEPNMTPDEFGNHDHGIPLPYSGTDEPVTLENKNEQLSQALRNVTVNNEFEAFEAISEGLFELIPREVFRGLSDEQFKNLICVRSVIHVDEFLRFTNFIGRWEPGRREWITQVITELSQDQLTQLLRFITGIQVLPIGGFPALRFRINIQAYPYPAYQYPKGHTCYETLDWPQYESLEDTRTTLVNMLAQGFEVGMAER